MALSELQLQMTQATFDAWLRGSRLLQYDDKDSVFVIGVKNNLAKDWLENRLLTTITRTLRRLLVDKTAVPEVSFVTLDSDG